MDTALDLTNLKNAADEFLKTLERTVTLETAEENFDFRFGRNATLQTFETAYEVAWKIMRRWLAINVGAETVDGLSRRDLFRFAAENRLIDDPQAWWTFHQARNTTSHLYDGAIAMEVYQVAKTFAPALKRLIAVMESKV